MKIRVFKKESPKHGVYYSLYKDDEFQSTYDTEKEALVAAERLATLPEPKLIYEKVIDDAPR